MKVYVIFTSEFDETTMHEIWADKAKAEARTNELKTGMYVKSEFYIEEEEVRE